MIAVLAVGMGTSCVNPGPSLRFGQTKIATASKIERLLLWLPAGDSTFDAGEFGDALTKTLISNGVQVQAGRSTALELNREDDQKQFSTTFKPTHRLEIDVASSGSTQSGFGPTFSWVAVRGALYGSASKDPLLVFAFSPKRIKAQDLASQVVEKFRAEGLL